MEVGYYLKHPVDYNAYRVPSFNIKTNFSSGFRTSCGANALSMITGRNEYDIYKELKRSDDIQDKTMLAYLRRRNYKVVPITVCNMTNSDYADNKIHNDNVILCSQIMVKNEASWTVLYNGYVYHNFSQSPIYPLEFINRPILTAYVVWHKKWNKICH